MKHDREVVLALFLAHLVALVFGLVGLLIMLPHPDLWASDPRAVRVFDWSMKYAGSVHILFGAAAMFAYGVTAIGWRKTGIFAVVSAVLSLTFELVGTGTGWPFGNYAYTNFLGWKVLGRVPYTIPLSWFYMGFAAYLLGSVLAGKLRWHQQSLWSCLFGAFFLSVWDLVLDPAMAHQSLRIRFWEWSDTGAYFGMPVKNLIGWSLTGLCFMALSRICWRADVTLDAFPAIPLGVYAANLLFAMVISASVGLWWPIVLAVALGVVPAILLSRWRPVIGRMRARQVTADA
jgi:putative membrane protein